MKQEDLITWIYNLIQSNNIRKFYKSKHWRKLRAEVLKESNNECQMCKRLGKYSRGDVVHHIEHVTKQPSLALTRDNLMCVCADCHNKLHPEKSFAIYHKKKKEPLNEEKW